MKNLNIDKSSWKPVKFGDVVVEPKETITDLAASGLEHIVGLEHIDTESIHLRRSAGIEESTTFTKRFAVGDVLFGRRRAYLKKAAQASFDGICSGDITVLRAKKNLLPELLPFIVNNDKFFDYAVKHSAGGLSPRVKFKDLANYEFLLPPKEQQAELAELLWVMDEVIEKDLAVLEKLTVLVTSTRKNVFENNRWAKEKLKVFFDVQLGKMLSKKSTTGQNSFPYLANQNVQWGKIQFNKLNKMDFNEREKQKFKLEYGDLLVCEGGEVGRTAIWKDEIENCFYQKALHRLRVKNNSYLPEVMLEFMYWAGNKGLFKGQTGHSTIAHLTAVTLKEIPVPRIPMKEQKNLKAKNKELNNLVLDTESKISASKALQKSLINEVF